MKKKDVLNYIRVAGYHGDTAAGVRLLIENRVSRRAYDKAFNEGANLKTNGLGCSCARCSE